MPSSTPVYAGTRVSAGAVLSRAIPVLSYKAVATSITSSTTLTADPDLVVALGASTVYKIRMVLLGCSGGLAGAMKFAFTVPAGTTGNYTYIAEPAGAAGIIITDALATGGTLTAAETANANQGLILDGLIITGGTAGNLTLTWAQNTSNGTATVVGVNSYLEATQAL